MAIDPGGTTGLAAAYVEPEKSVKETLLNARMKKATEVEGTWTQQAQKLAQIMSRFVFTANVEQLVPLSNIHFAIEDFVLRRRETGGATGNLTSVWVAAATVAIFDIEATIHWQQPSHAKTFATDARLKLWDLYERGSEHKKDSWRHLAMLVNTLVE